MEKLEDAYPLFLENYYENLDTCVPLNSSEAAAMPQVTGEVAQQPEIKELLQNSAQNGTNEEFFRKRYLNELFFTGLGSYSGVVLMTELHEKFEEFYNTDFLSAISCDLDKKYTWLKRILNESYKASPPIKHLLLILFLGYSIEDFVKLPEIITPFGQPPFPCLNLASNHFGELRIKGCDIKKQREKITATFACDCGFVYRRFGFDETGQRHYEYDFIISFGDVWLGKLRELHKRGYDAVRIASELKVSVSTIKNAIKRLLLEESNPHRYRVGNTGFSPEKIEMMRKAYRAEWLKIRHENPDLSRAELKKILRP